METPVVLIIFRRPELTRRLIGVLRRVQPRKVLVVADGPRDNHPDDQQACAETRAVIDEIDWDCEVFREFSDKNLGCGVRPHTGISWAFDQISEAIILEDDCLPDPSFFKFCSELLTRYRDDERVMHISGCTYLKQEWETDDSYFFTKFPACWGWATWKRAWEKFEYNVPSWPERRKTNWLADIFGRDDVAGMWGREFETAHRGGLDLTGWDYQWAYACWENSGISIFPRMNLVSNVGHGEDATHTFWNENPVMNLPVGRMEFPMSHPETVEPDNRLDRLYVERVLYPASGCKKPDFIPYVKHKTRRFLRAVYRRVIGRSRTKKPASQKTGEVI